MWHCCMYLQMDRKNSMFNTALFAQIQFTIIQAITLKNQCFFLKLCLFGASTYIKWSY